MKIHVLALNISLLFSAGYMKADENTESNNTIHNENQTLLNELKEKKANSQVIAVKHSKEASRLEESIKYFSDDDKEILDLTRRFFNAMNNTAEGKSLFNEISKSAINWTDKELMYAITFLLPLYTEQQIHINAAQETNEHVSELDTRIKEIEDQIIANQNNTN